MSLFPNSIFSRRKSESTDHKTWHPSSQNHGFPFPLAPYTPPPHVGTFPREFQSPMVNNTTQFHIERKETPEAHVFKAHLPSGLKQSDVRVEVDDDRVLCIICEQSVEMEEQRGRWHHVKVSSGHFVQRLTLPENSKVDHVKASMDNGVLTIHVPKHRVVNNRVRNVHF